MSSVPTARTPTSAHAAASWCRGYSFGNAPTSATTSASTRMRMRASIRSIDHRSRPSRPTSGTDALAEPRQRPARELGDDRVGIVERALEHGHVLAAAAVAQRYDGVPPEPARVVARHVQPVVLLHERAAVGLEPRDEVDRRVGRRLLARAALLDAAVPRAHVLADVAAVDHVAERRAVGLGDRRGRL